VRVVHCGCCCGARFHIADRISRFHLVILAVCLEKSTAVAQLNVDMERQQEQEAAQLLDRLVALCKDRGLEHVHAKVVQGISTNIYLFS